MNTCCGQDRTTPYCPMCGKQLVLPPAEELLAYVRFMGVNAEREREKVEKARYRDGGERLKQATENAAKWKRWADALEKLIAESEVKGG